MIVKDRFIRIRDNEADTGQLFSGSELIIHVDSISMSGGNTNQKIERGFQSIIYADPSTEAVENLETHYNRRKTNISFRGSQIPTITITGMMSNISIGSNTITLVTGNTTEEVKVITPTRFIKMCISGRQFHLRDGVLINSLNTLNSDSERIYGDNGVPVAIESWSMTPIFDDVNKGIAFNITFIEDKE